MCTKNHIHPSFAERACGVSIIEEVAGDGETIIGQCYLESVYQVESTRYTVEPLNLAEFAFLSDAVDVRTNTLVNELRCV